MSKNLADCQSIDKKKFSEDIKTTINGKVIVSACLAGETCSYNGRSHPCELVQQLVKEGRAIIVCPECLGGLPTPRPPAEIYNGSGKDVLEGKAKIFNNEGKDVTEAFLQGAYQALKIALKEGAKLAILKERSPSCGCNKIYDGTFSGKLHDGQGVTAALLTAHGITIYSENEAKICLKK